MNKGLIISVIGHGAVLAAIAYLGSLQPPPPKRGYPTLMMATLIQRPMMAQASGTLSSSQPVLEARPIAPPPQPELKPVPSTKLGTKTPEPPKKKEEKKPEPQPQTQTQTTSPAGGTGRRSGAATGGSVGTGIKIDAPEFPYPHYLVLLQFRIEGNWRPPFSGIGEEITTIYFKITADGEIEDVRIEKSSGNFALDQAALRAVRESNPLPPLPSNSGLQTLGVHFDFVAN